MTATATAEAKIREKDAASERKIGDRSAAWNLKKAKKDDADARKRQKRADKRKEARDKRKENEGKRERKAAARSLAWAAFTARTATTLGGRLIGGLVVLAVATAWVGQYGALKEQLASVHMFGWSLGSLFAAAGASALEMTGLAMGDVVRKAVRRGERALVARAAMWTVIAGSSAANYLHFGSVMAGLSVLGPVSWEVHEWGERREQLHAAGQVTPRPRRPRWPLDRWVLLFWPTLQAYRLAVQFDLTDPAAAVAAADHVAASKAASRSAAKAAKEKKGAASDTGQQAAEQRPAVPAADAEQTGQPVAQHGGQQAASTSGQTGQPVKAKRPAGPASRSQQGGQPVAEEPASRTGRSGFRLINLGIGKRPATGQPEQNKAASDAASNRPAAVKKAASAPASNRPALPAGPASTTGQLPASRRPATTDQAASKTGQHGGQPVRTDRPAAPATPSTSGYPPVDRTGQPDISDVLPAARQIVISILATGGKPTKDAVLDALRGQGLSVGGDRKTALWQTLRGEKDHLAAEAAAPKTSTTSSTDQVA
ncbi:DUF2637 domain-containing protein [Pseudonocardiaceae bacterium YIM PH 21723]|nr:DUF2637 domain-containing protein [Pseudonocardiaceae bacterium YIM PH 21723]